MKKLWLLFALSIFALFCYNKYIKNSDVYLQDARWLLDTQVKTGSYKERPFKDTKVTLKGTRTPLIQQIEIGNLQMTTKRDGSGITLYQALTGTDTTSEFSFTVYDKVSPFYADYAIDDNQAQVTFTVPLKGKRGFLSSELKQILPDFNIKGLTPKDSQNGISIITVELFSPISTNGLFAYFNNRYSMTVDDDFYVLIRYLDLNRYDLFNSNIVNRFEVTYRTHSASHLTVSFTKK